MSVRAPLSAGMCAVVFWLFNLSSYSEPDRYISSGAVLLRLFLDIHDLIGLVHALHESIPVGYFGGSDTCAESKFVGALLICLFNGISEASDELTDTRRTVEDEYGNEFVTADPRGDLAFVEDGLQAVSDAFQRFVTGGMSEIIVDVFKTIHIDAGNRDLVFADLFVGKVLGDALLKTATPFVLRGMGVPADWETLALWQ